MTGSSPHCGNNRPTVDASLWAVFPTAILLTCESLFDASLSALLAAALLWATLAVAESRRTAPMFLPR
jgi:hypothetical protein